MRPDQLPEQMQHLVAIDEVELGEGEDPFAVERRLEREVEAVEGLDGGEPAHLQRRLDAAALAQGVLLGEQGVDGFERGELAALELTHQLIEDLQRAGHLQPDQVAADALERGRGAGAHGVTVRAARARPTVS